MERKYEAELDALRVEVEEIRTLVNRMAQVLAELHIPAAAERESDAPDYKKCWVGKVQKMRNMHPNQHIMALMDDLENKTGHQNISGAITYLGVYTSGGRQSSWVRKDVNTDHLLRLIEDHSAERVLACIGNNDRLNLLLALLRRPMTVAQLVEECGYHSTGQVYHHLKPLMTADLVAEDNRSDGKGRYTVVSHRVQGIMMLLAGISDMLDPTYTEGSWIDDADSSHEKDGEQR